MLKEQLEPLNSGFVSGLQMVCIKIMLNLHQMHQASKIFLQADKVSGMEI